MYQKTSLSFPFSQDLLKSVEIDFAWKKISDQNLCSTCWLCHYFEEIIWSTLFGGGTKIPSITKEMHQSRWSEKIHFENIPQIKANISLCVKLGWKIYLCITNTYFYLKSALIILKNSSKPKMWCIYTNLWCNLFRS